MDWLKRVNKDWTLFLDRDGVINVKPENDYVKEWAEFRFLPGAKEAIARLTGHFKYIILLTNQQGIGKGLMTDLQLANIHDKMLNEIRLSGGRVDAIYYCGALAEEHHPDRKPGTGMAIKAQRDHVGIDLARAMMVGDSHSDMQMADTLGMKKIFIGENADLVTGDVVPDVTCSSLLEFSELFLASTASSVK